MLKKFLTFGYLFFHLLSQAQNYDAELLKQETNITVTNNELIRISYFEIRINNRAGEIYTHVTIPYSKINKVSRINAYIKDISGKTIRKLKMNEITEKSSISSYSFYEDDFVKEFTLKHNSYPYIIVYSYQSEEDEFFYIDYWTPVLDKRVPTISASLKVSVPENYVISFSNQNLNKPLIDTLEDNIRYFWQTSYKATLKPEVYTPPITDYFPRVAIVPHNFKFELNGSLENWISYGNWQYNLLQGLNELPVNEKNKIMSLIKDIGDETEKIKILYHYLQDATRYVNIMIENGGLKPYPASYVSENKYGDCKALTNYFKSILDYIGIESFYTNINAGNPIKEIDLGFPSQQFNHVILYIPLQNDSIWLDCTSDGAFNHLGTFTQNRNAFIINKNSSFFLRTPQLGNSEVLESRRVEIYYKQKNEFYASFQNSSKGELFESLLALEQNFNENDKSRIIRNYIAESGIELINYKVSKGSRDSSEIQLSYEAVIQDIYKQYGKEILVGNIPFSLPEFENPANRNLPVQLDFPIFKIDTIIYDNIPGYALSEGIFTHELLGKYGHYKVDINEQGNKIQVVKSVLFKSGFYPVSEYKDFYKFYKEINENEEEILFTLIKL